MPMGWKTKNRGKLTLVALIFAPQFIFLLAILIWSPLPLASNRPWSLALLGLLVCVLALWTLARPPAAVRRGGRSPVRRAWPALTLMAAWVALLAFQMVPLPASVLTALESAGSGYPVLNAGLNPISVDWYSTRLYLLKGVTLGLFFWLLLTWVNSAERLEWLVKTLVASGLLQALLAVALFAMNARYWLFFVDVTHEHAKGTFNNYDHFAGYMEMTLALGIGLMIAKLDGRPASNWRQRLRNWLALLLSKKAVLRLGLVVMVIGLIASHSRMGNSAFFVSLLTTGLITIFLSKHATRSMVIFIASLVILDVVIIGGVVGIERVVLRIESTNMTEAEKHAALDEAKARVATGDTTAAPIVRYREQSLEERIQPGLHTLAIVRDFPFFGTGGGTFHTAFMAYRPQIITLWYDHAHNDYMEFTADGGLLGVGLLAAIVLMSVAFDLIILVRRHDPFALGMAFASLMGILALLQHSTVDFNLQIPANAMLFITIIALPYMVGWKYYRH